MELYYCSRSLRDQRWSVIDASFGIVCVAGPSGRLSKTEDPLEVLDQVVDFKQFREPPERALGYADGSKGGRPPYDSVVMFKILILVARQTVGDETRGWSF